MFRVQWPTVRLYQVLSDLQPGFARDPGDGDVGTPQLRTNNVDVHGEISLQTVKRVDASDAEFKKYLVEPGDVVFNNTNSPELVGKTAFFSLDEKWLLSNHMTRLRGRPEVVDPEFLARVLHFYWKMGFSGRRAKQWVNQAAVDSVALSSFPIPLPPLSEQRRIVEILNEARDIRGLRQQADELTTQLIPAIFNEMFGGPNGYTHLPEVAIRKVVESAEYGTSKAANDHGVGVPVLRMNNVTYEGELDLSDIKYVALSETELKKQLLRENDVLFNRTNSLELVGKSGLWDGRIEAVAASYFVRVRLDLERVDPRFFVAFLNLASTKRRLQNMAKQAIGMSNINATELQRIRMPLPDLALQRKFGDRVAAIREYKHSVADSVVGEERLTQSILAYAFSGELTANWRAENRELLAKETADRDQWLRENGVKLTTTDHPRQATARTDGLAWELNRDQRALLEQIHKLDRNENGGLFTLSTLKLDAPLDKLPPDALRRHLDVLASRGLILAVSRRAGTGESVIFGNVYRVPLGDEDIMGTAEQPDHARLSELERLSRQGRVHNISATSTLHLIGSAEVSVTRAEGDE